VATNIAFNFLESDPFHALLSKNQFPGSREYLANRICIPAFPGMTKWLSRGKTSHDWSHILSFSCMHAIHGVGSFMSFFYYFRLCVADVTKAPIFSFSSPACSPCSPSWTHRVPLLGGERQHPAAFCESSLLISCVWSPSDKETEAASSLSSTGLKIDNLNSIILSCSRDKISLIRDFY
jgi:hypothetical protein